LACSSKTTGLSRPAITEAEPFGQLLCDVAGYSGRQGNLVRKALDLLALTFVRPGTVTQAEWDEFDPDGALWTIPFKKLKQRKLRESIKELTGKPHYVPLSRQAVAFLRELKKQTGDGRYLFPNRKGRPISTNALEVALNAASCFARYVVGCGCNFARHGAVSSSLLEHRPAGFAEAGLLPPQAGGNCPHIRDLAWTKTIDVGGAGFFLFRRCLRS
jgi:hypothetical protein